ncbi:fatty acyl-CoA reductase 1-like [Atheta coriaria]|uniref:fatty acyl-CoA reductase 1-like n=1 Tax=Dalotia coriaria TaxID=877792 RepID=UPI0031F3CF45
MNVRGTRSMLEMAKNMSHLQLFCHVSSAYCHVHERIIYEKAYDPPADPGKIVEICENLSEADLSAFTHKILDNYPNTYCFSKALSEGLVNKELNKLPIILLRPSLVIPALKDPIPGWTDTINGSIGFQIAAGKGILRTLYADVTRYPDLIPVDITVNAFICAAYDFLRHPENKRPRNIYNLTTSDQYKVSWYDIIYIGRDVILNSIPLNWVVWYPGGSIKGTRFQHDCTFFIQHVLPSIIVDSILWIFNRPPILLPIYRRIQKGFEILKFYNGKQWDFSNKESRTAIDSLNLYEKQKYNFHITKFDYKEYFRDCTLCARRYILKESDESIPRARKHMKM